MRDLVDTHTHTLASGHAYSTIRENARMAAQRGLELLAITEHAPRMPGSCHELYFHNLRVVDRDAYEVPLLLGVELNILDTEGNVDLETPILRRMDIAIASLHTPCIRPGSRRENTRAILKTMENPYVNIIGHPDDPRYPLDYPEVVRSAREHGVLLELNNSSLRPGGSRQGAEEMDRKLLELCMRYEVPIVIGSDAHVDTDVGNHRLALELLEKLQFPESLVMNADPRHLKSYVNRYKNG